MVERPSFQNISADRLMSTRTEITKAWHSAQVIKGIFRQVCQIQSNL